MSLADRLSLTAILHAANTGRQAFSVQDYLNRFGGTGSILSGRTDSYTLSQAESSMLYRPEDISRDPEHMATFDFSYRPTKQFRLTGNLIGSRSRPAAETQGEDLFVADRTAVTRSSIRERDDRWLLGRVDTDWKMGRHTEWATRTRLGLTDLCSDAGATGSGGNA